MIDEPLFPHAHAALVFAFRFSGQSGAAPTPMAKLMRGPAATGKGLAGLDGAAQAGMIRCEVEALEPILRNIIVARFAFEDLERLRALLALIPHAAEQLGTGINSRRMVDTLVQRYFGARVLLCDLAEQIGVHSSTVTRTWQKIYARFQADEARAGAEIGDRLRIAGLVP
jgi:DNA-binding transcriptional ArsR family regulator